MWGKKREREKTHRTAFTKFVFALFSVFFYPLFVCIICVGIFLFASPRPLSCFFWLGYKALMKAFQANMLIFVSMGIQEARQCHRGFGQQTDGKQCCLFPSFIHIVSLCFSSTLHLSCIFFFTTTSLFLCSSIFKFL